MRFGFAVPAYGSHASGPEIHDLLVAGDELGYESAWFPDHVAVPDYAEENVPGPFLEPLSTCGWALGVTTRLRLGTDVLVAPYRHPLLVSAMTGSLGLLANDRLILGVGVGYLRGEFDVLGAAPYEDRGRVTDDFLRTQRKPPDGYSVICPNTPVPIWVGGNGAAARRRAALLGDGWHPLWMSDNEYRAARRQILDIRAEAGRHEPFTFSYSCGRTALLTRRRSSWPEPPGRAPAGSEFRYAPASWVDTDHRPRFVGTADQLIADFTLLQQAGVDHVTLRFGSTDIGDLVRFATDVKPAFDG